MLTVRETRQRLGLSIRAFAQLLGCSISSVVNWEQGYAVPSLAWAIRMRAIARTRGLTKRTHGPIPIVEYYQAKMDRYERKPGPEWMKWSGQKRASFYACRAKYRRIRADIDAGRAIACPITDLLDATPDLARDADRLRRDVSRDARRAAL